MAAPVIALLTDFGSASAFAGIMKGVIAARAPDAAIIDITHGVAPQDILQGAFLLATAVPYFPPHTVFLAVVDPGVGTARRAICLDIAGRRFVGPDNGLLWPAATSLGVPRAVEVNNPAWRLPKVSTTFHGRDIFAPAAAELARGWAISQAGPPLPDPVRLEFPQPEKGDRWLSGQVLFADTFGNLITNIKGEWLAPPPAVPDFAIGGAGAGGLQTNFEALAPGRLGVVLGSAGYVEIAVRNGSAWEALNPADRRRAREPGFVRASW